MSVWCDTQSSCWQGSVKRSFGCLWPGPPIMGSSLAAFCINQSSGKLMLRVGHGLFSRRILFSGQGYCGSEYLLSCLTWPKASRIICAFLTLEVLRRTWATFLGVLQELTFHLFNMMAYFTEMLVHVFCPAEVPAWRRLVQETTCSLIGTPRLR